MASVKELLEKVKAATGPDRELDRAIQKAFDIGPTSFTQDEFNHWPIWVTGSVDAALALTERLLPGWQINISTFGNVAEASVGGRGVLPYAQAPTAPLAILQALLTALSAIKEVR